MAELFDLRDLNPPQRQAVLHESGPLLILAGAGSGKTRVITYRIARLLREGVPAPTILAVTFTNKAAKEMRERLLALAGRAGQGVVMSTFHALGLRIIKAEAEAAGLQRGFCIYDTADQIGLVRELMRQVKVADRRLDVGKVLDVILKTKRARKSEVELDWGDDYELAAYDLYPRYIDQMRAFNAIDFDDLILRTQDLLADPDVRERWSQQYEHLLIDEYQDTSPDQLELIRVLAGGKRNLCVVGDDDQSIYAWRGAAAGNILLFGEHFAGATEVVLEQNYRSTNSILQAANAVIACNSQRKEKRLWSDKGAGEPVDLVVCENPEDEAAFVCETAARLRMDGHPYDDMAVLYRSNLQSQVFEEALALEHVPFRVVGGQSFFDRKEVRDVLAYLAFVSNPRDEIALRRIVNVPPRGLGPASLERLVAHAHAQGYPLVHALRDAAQVSDLPKAAVVAATAFVAELDPFIAEGEKLSPHALPGFVERLIEKLGLRDAVVAADDAPSVAARRLENLRTVQAQAKRYSESRDVDVDEPLTGFVRTASLVRDDAKEEESSEGRLTLMTLHSAKGLEFPYVILVGCEEDLLPHRRTIDGQGDMSEERRLCYVGMTRARKRLWMSRVLQRKKHGKLMPCSPSRFLSELPKEGIRERNRAQVENNPESADLAQDFFRKMKAQLGIEESGHDG